MPTELFLIDTSAWIFALRKNFVVQIKERVDSLLKDDVILTTGLIKLELLGGTRTQKEFYRLKNRLAVLEEIEINTVLWESSFELAFTLRRKGVTVPYTDIIIAACALNANAILVHADSHFDLISNHSSLRVESYVDIVQG
ncbi:MAG TPA: PIN domain-containing protein [Desulfobacterales bacterium]|nr:MAG: hypothetical protein DRH12_15170 [Deltaproteobacteria bacterium]HDG98268.1 PIN domain-containing protein [Desulfobacterales bacterium]